MRASGRKASFMARASRLCRMGRFSTASGRRADRLAKAGAYIPMAPSTLGVGSTANRMGSASRFCLTARNTRETGWTVRRMARARRHYQMEQSTMDSGTTVNSSQASATIPTVKCTRESGLMENLMVRESRRGQMVGSMTGCGIWESLLGEEGRYTLTEELRKVTGRTASSLRVPTLQANR